MQFITFRILLNRIKAITQMMRDKSVRWYKKALILFGIIYLLSPIDLVPSVVPVLGILDDIVLWGMIIFYLKDELDTYWLGEKRKDYSREYSDTVDSVNYTVNENEVDENEQ